MSLALRQSPDVMALNVRVVHAESLHAHDAVAQSRWTREAA
ncbi:GTP cyclohydrolase I type 2 [Pseudomonas sp. SHC52]|nr:GTP cyclohydrolase I type 2 [Pseudomonas sp. SHC52]